MVSRISSAVLVHTSDRGFSFQVATHWRIDCSNSWTLRWLPRRSHFVDTNHRWTRSTAQPALAPTLPGPVADHQYRHTRPGGQPGRHTAKHKARQASSPGPHHQQTVAVLGGDPVEDRGWLTRPQHQLGDDRPHGLDGQVVLTQPHPDRLGLPLQLLAQACLPLAPGDAVVDLGHRHQGEPPHSAAQQVKGAGGGRCAFGRPVDADQDIDRAGARDAAGNQPRRGRLVPGRQQRQQQRDRPEHQSEQAPGEGLCPSRPITIASTKPMHANVAISSDKNTVNGTCLTYLSNFDSNFDRSGPTGDPAPGRSASPPRPASVLYSHVSASIARCPGYSDQVQGCICRWPVLVAEPIGF
jgi:hypothetical protein